MADLDLQLDWLRSFVAVVDAGSFTAAAARVHRAQSRVSAHIGHLEHALGTQIIVRSRPPLHLTPAGELFLGHARAALHAVDTGQAAVAGLRGEVRGSLRLASFPGASAILLAPVIRAFTEKYPGVQIELFDGLPDEVTAMVLHDQADIAFRQADPPISASSLRSRKLFLEPVVCVVPHDHPFAHQKVVPEYLLNGQSIIMTANPGERAAHLSYILREVGITPGREILVGQPTTVAAFSNAGLGIGIMPAMAAEVCTFGPLRTLRIEGNSRWWREVIMLTNRNHQISRAEEVFLHSLRTSVLPGALKPLPWFQLSHGGAEHAEPATEPATGRAT
jgi:DNA-binding transcriptional LysR family regulator